MTKKEWSNITEGCRVTMQRYDHRVNADITYTGTVKRLNSNYSQALVKWDNTGSEIWYGRLGIEMIKK